MHGLCIKLLIKTLLCYLINMHCFQAYTVFKTSLSTFFHTPEHDQVVVLRPSTFLSINASVEVMFVYGLLLMVNVTTLKRCSLFFFHGNTHFPV